MRKIEQNMLRAVVGMQSWHSDNTMVTITPGTKAEHFTPLRGEVFLHGNHIATMDYSTGALRVNKQTLARWPSSTTKSRLRALGVNVTTRKGVTYLNGVAI